MAAAPDRRTPARAARGAAWSVALGPISFGAGASHANTNASGSGSNYNNASSFSRQTANFDGTTLSINGAQVIAFVSDIVPPSPDIDDPALPKPKAATNNTIAGPATATATQTPATTTAG